MEKIAHRNVQVNGINMHFAEIGEGPAVLFVHGFPEFWYSWRYQMLSLSSRGYRAIAPDLRGFGDTDAPPSATSYTVFHVVGDLVGLLDSLGLDKVFVVAHDWGAAICWYLCLFRPDRVKAFVSLSIVFEPRNPARKPIESLHEMFGDDYYICRFQEAGSEELFEPIDSESLVAIYLLNRDPRPPRLPKSFAGFQKYAPPLPSWLSQEDLTYSATKFRTNFANGLNYYRCIDRNWELTAAWTGSKVEVPVKCIIGDLDATYHFPGTKEYIDGGGFKKNVPNLEAVVVMEGVGHSINQEKAEEINNHIYYFIRKF